MAYHAVFFLGTGADFYEQLKLDFSRHFSESTLLYYKKYFLQLNISAYMLV